MKIQLQRKKAFNKPKCSLDNLIFLLNIKLDDFFLFLVYLLKKTFSLVANVKMTKVQFPKDIFIVSLFKVVLYWWSILGFVLRRHKPIVKRILYLISRTPQTMVCRLFNIYIFGFQSGNRCKIYCS